MLQNITTTTTYSQKRTRRKRDNRTSSGHLYKQYSHFTSTPGGRLTVTGSRGLFRWWTTVLSDHVAVCVEIMNTVWVSLRISSIDLFELFLTIPQFIQQQNRLKMIECLMLLRAELLII